MDHMLIVLIVNRTNKTCLLHHPAPSLALTSVDLLPSVHWTFYNHRGEDSAMSSACTLGRLHHFTSFIRPIFYGL